jgi:regulatory protein
MDATITAIKQQKRNPQRVNIYLDGNYAFPLTKIVAAWLKVGQKLSPEKIQQLQGHDETEKAFQRAINFISYRPRSQAEVEKNLQKHEVPEALVPEIIERLKKGNLLNDEEFARRWVDDRSTFRPRGPFALKVELRQKGISDEAIEQAIADLDEAELAKEAALRQARRLSKLEWPDFRTKLSAHLSRRGFSYETVATACQEAWNQLNQETRQEA